MKNSKILLLIAATTITVFSSCKKDLMNESTVTPKTTQTTPKAENANGAQSESSTVLSYSALVSNLLQREFRLIETPRGYVSQIKLSDYPGTTLELYQLQNVTVEVYKFPAANVAAQAAAENDCVYKENAGGGTQTAGCYESGNDCKVKVETLNGTTTVTIVCC